MKEDCERRCAGVIPGGKTEGKRKGRPLLWWSATETEVRLGNESEQRRESQDCLAILSSQISE